MNPYAFPKLSKLLVDSHTGTPILLAAAWPVHRPSSFCCVCTWHLSSLSEIAGMDNSPWEVSSTWILASAWKEKPWTTVPTLLRRIHTWARWMSSAEGGHGTCTVRCLKESEHSLLNFWCVHGPTTLFLCKFSVENALATAPSCLSQAGSPICGAILKLSMKGEQLQIQVVPKKRWVHACNRFIPTSARVRPPLLHFLRQRRPKLAELQTDTLQKSERHSDTITSKPIWIAKFCSSSLCRTQSKLSKTYDIAISKARDATEAHFHSFTLAKSGIFFNHRNQQCNNWFKLEW